MIRTGSQFYSRLQHRSTSQILPNLLLKTDVYKMGHCEQYPNGTQQVYSYLMARSDKTIDKTVFFGLQYYLKEYLTLPILDSHVDEFMEVRKQVLGSNQTDKSTENKLRNLVKLGYLPLEIKAVPEGTVMETRNVLMTITNTHNDYYWMTGFVESLLLKLWYSTTVASMSYKYRQLVDKYFYLTVSKDSYFLKPFMVHDFGYRGDSSEEGAGISGAGHLLSFTGSDTIPAFPFLRKYYQADLTLKLGKSIMMSVPASEHSVMCAFGKNNEIDAYKNMLKIYPTGLVSIVSDTYDIWNVLTKFAKTLKQDILERDGKVVFRPDSGNPEYIICGDPNVDKNSPAGKGCVVLLDEMFGSTVNDKGYKVLNNKIGLIYGDGMYLERYEKTLERLKQMGYASSNLVIGVGGILRNHGRDTMGFAIKATNVMINDKDHSIFKDPITDSGKKSHTGFMRLERMSNGRYVTRDQITPEDAEYGLLRPVFRNGELLIDESLEEIRERVETHIKDRRCVDGDHD